MSLDWRLRKNLGAKKLELALKGFYPALVLMPLMRMNMLNIY